MRMTPEAALSLLFSSAMKAIHPDTAGQTPATPAELKDARDTLRQLVAPGVQNNPCGTCNGDGMVRARFGKVLCGTCKGTGDSR